MMASHCRAPGCTATDLCRAHIIPQGFARDVRSGGEENLKITAAGRSRAFPPLGDYDTNILCASCDGFLGTLDGYALETFQRFDSLPLTLGTTVKLPGVDGDRIARFAISLFWRASITTRPLFAKIALGPYEQRAGEVAFGKAPLSALPEYELIAYRYRSDGTFDPRRFYSAPSHGRMDGLNTLSIALAGLRLVAKIDRRSLPALLHPIIVNGNDALHAFVVDYRSGADFRTMEASIKRDLLSGRVK